MATLGEETIQEELSVEKEQDENNPTLRRRLTPFERLSNDLSNDQKVMKEITLGKRIGFYRIRGEIGTGNFSQAAELSNISQPAFSRRIKTLEAWVGVTLIDRSRQPVKLTEAGTQMLEAGLQALTRIE